MLLPYDRLHTMCKELVVLIEASCSQVIDSLFTQDKDKFLLMCTEMDSLTGTEWIEILKQLLLNLSEGRFKTIFRFLFNNTNSFSISSIFFFVDWLRFLLPSLFFLAFAVAKRETSTSA